jgi:PIN domain nuclease of toxin-antitoxin system
MRLLLDTHAFLWYYSGSPELSERARLYIDDPKNTFYVSMASLWEIAIKNSLGKLALDKDFDTFCADAVAQGFRFLPIDMAHLMKAATLPFHHRDPFDRMLVAQAIAEHLDFITKDTMMEAYFQHELVRVLW